MSKLDAIYYLQIVNQADRAVRDDRSLPLANRRFAAQTAALSAQTLRRLGAAF